MKEGPRLLIGRSRGSSTKLPLRPLLELQVVDQGSNSLVTSSAKARKGGFGNVERESEPLLNFSFLCKLERRMIKFAMPFSDFWITSGTQRRSASETRRPIMAKRGILSAAAY
jgi:hypothetical protein